MAVLRGGSWGGNDYALRVAYRTKVDPTSDGDDIGFRCVQ
ncbi:MAG: SUMF1/EgtB/PvdO family nonheme iron enzyme [bacterium]